MSIPVVDTVAAYAASRFDATLGRLVDYLAIPAISCDPNHFDDVRRLARVICDDLSALGLTGARVLELPNALPSV
ncbi:MAG: hypothetical protein ACI9MC_003666, partial [Kiritimatiellia bacterium]